MRELLTSRLNWVALVSCVSLILVANQAEAQTSTAGTGWRPSRPARASRPATPSASKIDPFQLPPAAPVRQVNHSDMLGDVQLGPGEILVSAPAYEPLPPGAVIQGEPMPAPGPRSRFMPAPPMVGPNDYVGIGCESCGGDCGGETCGGCETCEPCGAPCDPFPFGLLRGFRFLFCGCCDDGCGDSRMNTAPGDCGGCNSCGPDGCCDRWVEPNCGESSYDACAPCMQWCWLQDATIFGGVEGFKGPMDQGTNGNFGYHAGANYAFPLWCRFGLGLQTGVQVNATNLSGNPLAGVTGTGEQRTQVFATTALFHRSTNEVWGWNWGVAYDYLNDDYFDSFMYSQVRVEVSRRFACYHEFGFLGAFGVRNDNFIDPVTQLDTETTVLDQYLGFYRHRFQRGGEGRILLGVSGNSDAIIGADAVVPFSQHFALETSGVYVIPGEGSSGDSATQEIWNLQTSIVWYPGRTGLTSVSSRYRPLFGVANAGSMMTIR